MQRQEERVFEDEGQPKLRIMCTQHAALQSFRLMGRLGKLLGPALRTFRGVKFKGQDVGALAPMLASLFEDMDSDKIESLTKDILAGCLAVGVGGKALSLDSAENIDLVFSGRLLTMFKVMAFALEVNYRDFQKGLSDGAKKENGVAESPTAELPSP
jgi:hypothetical protein